MFEQELSRLSEQNLLRRLAVINHGQGPAVSIEGKKVLLFCSNDYLGLAAHPALREAASDALDRYGFGSGASRLVSGTSPLHQELEQRIARFKGTESALVFNSGYAANTGIIPALVKEDDVVLSDSLNHASIIDGCRLSRARIEVYRHGDLEHAEDLLRKNRSANRRLIVTDGVFSMDGDLAPLPGLVSLSQKYDALLMIDDAHATGVLGRTGRGTGEHFGIKDGIHIQMGTLGKALGSFGAYAAGSRDLIDYLLNRARSFIFSTALPPAVCAASLAAFTVIENRPELRERLWQNQAYYVNALKERGIETGPTQTPIVPIMVGDTLRACIASERLFERGIFASSIRPPTVPDGTSRIRTTVTAMHSRDELDKAIQALKDLKQNGFL